MRFTFEETSRDGREVDVLTDHESGLRIEVSRRGAELVSFSRRDKAGEWIGFLYRDGDLTHAEAGWNNHATVMGYYTHRIKDGLSLYQGHEIRGETHSFLRLKNFGKPEVQSEESASLTYRLPPEEILPEEYPYRVAFAITYALEGDTLRVTFEFENREPHAAHVSFGLHPGFAGASLDSCDVRMPPGKYARHFAPGNFLSGEVEVFDFPGGPMPFERADLLKSFLLELKKVDAPLFVFADSETRRHVYLNFAGAPYVTIWSDGHAFICVEPCWGLPDHHEQRPFEEKEGIQEIAPGAVLRRSFTMAPMLGV